MKELKPCLMGAKNVGKKNNDGRYYGVILMKNDGTQKNYKVHRLVGLFFLPNPKQLKCLDHIDGNKFNNKVSNLRWVTYQENRLNPSTAWKNERPVARYSLNGEYLDEKPSITAYKDEFGFDQSNITRCCKGKQKSAYGYKWQYIDKQGYLENF